MKKAEWSEYTIWICPYLKCQAENKDILEEVGSGYMVECIECRKTAELE